MTKKFIHTDKKLNGAKSKSEFLIPDIFENKNRFIGITSRKAYDQGLVVYTGVDLDENKILDKLPEAHSFNASELHSYKTILKNYLTQIKEMKIGKAVKLVDNFTLINSD